MQWGSVKLAAEWCLRLCPVPRKTHELGGKLQSCSNMQTTCVNVCFYKKQIVFKTDGRSLPGGKLSSDVKGKAKGFIASTNHPGCFLGSGRRKYEWLAEEEPSRLGNVREQNGESCCNWETWVWRMGLNSRSSFCQVSTKQSFCFCKAKRKQVFQEDKRYQDWSKLIWSKNCMLGLHVLFFKWQGLRESNIVADEASSLKPTLISFKGLINLGNR